MTDILLVLLAGMLCIISYQIHKLKEFIMATSPTFVDLLNDLAASVTPLTDVKVSVEQLLTNLSAAIDALTAQLADQSVSPSVIAQVAALKATLDTDKSDLAAAVVANTRPVVNPPPPPVGQG